MVKKLTHRARNERGAVLVLVAICMTIFLGMAALAIDVGSFYQQQRQMQAAADAAALAGAQDLPSSASNATTHAQTYGATNAGVPSSCNGTSPGVCVTTPYNTNSSQIKVTVYKNIPTFFGHIFGFTSANVSASAVAAANNRTTAPAVFADDSSCDGALTINGTGINIPAGVQTNGDFYQNGNNGTYGPSTYGGTTSCYHANGSGNTYGGVAYPAPPTLSTTASSWPIDYRTNPPTCTQNAASFTWNTNNAVIAPGVYCATGAIDFNGSNMTGNNVTFVADSFQLNGSNNQFTPGFGNLLVWQTGSSTLQLNINTSASNWLLNGATIFAPTALINVNADSTGPFSGFLEGYKVDLTGNNGFTLTGTGPTSSAGGGGLLR
jgi:Flp pilus assembly protein TadG